MVFFFLYFFGFLFGWGSGGGVTWGCGLDGVWGLGVCLPGLEGAGWLEVFKFEEDSAVRRVSEMK